MVIDAVKPDGGHEKCWTPPTNAPMKRLWRVIPGLDGDALKLCDGRWAMNEEIVRAGAP